MFRFFREHQEDTLYVLAAAYLIVLGALVGFFLAQYVFG
jgi:hypothetical protein